MYLTNLATIARSTGLPVVEQPGWQSRGHGPQSDVRAIICHHTGGPPTGNAPSLSTVINGRPDLPGPLAHFVLGRDGTVFVVAAGRCYHAGTVLSSNWANEHTIGIEAEATGTAAWPAVQMVAYAKLCRALSDAFGGVPVLGHKEVCSPVGRKVDPNFDMAAFRNAVSHATSGEDDDDVELSDKMRLFDGTENTVGNVLAGTLDRVAGKSIESKRYPGVKDNLAGFVSAMDANILTLLDEQRATNAKLDKLITLLTPKGA